MVRRILVTGLGGFGGLVLWFVRRSHLGWEGSATKIEMMRMFGWVVGCGVIVMILGEKLRIIPSQEQVDKKYKPISIFSTDDQDRESAPKPKAPALSSSEPESSAPIPEPTVEEIKRLTAQI